MTTHIFIDGTLPVSDERYYWFEVTSGLHELVARQYIKYPPGRYDYLETPINRDPRTKRYWRYLGVTNY